MSRRLLNLHLEDATPKAGNMGRDMERWQHASHVRRVEQRIQIRNGASLEDAHDDRRMRRVDGRIRLHVPEEVWKVSVAWHGGGREDGISTYALLRAGGNVGAFRQLSRG
jgi:hypothetical protein